MKRSVEELLIRNDEPLAKLSCSHCVVVSFLNDVQDLKQGDQVECLFCQQLVFPQGLVCYKKTPKFTHDTIPKGFLKAHSTKAGAWAKIVIHKGELSYVVDDLDDQQFTLNEETNGVIAPQMLHHIAAKGDVVFQVEFYREETQP